MWFIILFQELKNTKVCLISQVKSHKAPTPLQLTSAMYIWKVVIGHFALHRNHVAFTWFVVPFLSFLFAVNLVYVVVL